MDDELGIDSAGQNVLLATTLATFLLASSAFIWRSNIRNILIPAPADHRVRIENDVATPELPKEVKLSAAAAASRSKERRRRGKDPTKELLKSSITPATTTASKKAKTLGVPLTKLPPPTTSPIADSNSREPSLSTSRERSSRERNGSADLRTETLPSEEEETSHVQQVSDNVLQLSSEESVPKPPLNSDPWAWDGAGPSRKPPPVIPALSPPAPEEQPSPPAASPPTTRPSPSTTSSTPKRGSTPSAGTPSSGGDIPLSTQTQIASLRGALEAARMREEKSKVEVDRITKEVEALRWESSVWRRREVELQAHIHHLMHQLQGYAALYASLSSPQAAVAPQHLQVPTTGGGTAAVNGGSPTNPSPNGYHVPLPNSPSPMGALSPLSISMHPSPLSPFFGYPVHPHPQQPPHQQQPPQPYSVLFPTTASSSTVSGTSSNGSLSPPERHSSSNNSSPLAAPATVGAALLDRGRRRTRTQTANGRIGTGGGGWGDDNRDASAGDDEAEASTSSHDDTDEDEDEGFSEILADAILKRPESIRMASAKSLSSKKKRQKQNHQQEKDKYDQMEFTFPSLNASISASSFRSSTSASGTSSSSGGGGDDGWLEVEQHNDQEADVAAAAIATAVSASSHLDEEEEKEPIILSYHRPNYPSMVPQQPQQQSQSFELQRDVNDSEQAQEQEREAGVAADDNALQNHEQEVAS